MIALALLLAGCAPEEPPLVTELRDLAPVVVAHRGGDDLAPEGTLEAFTAAWEAGAHVLEVDLYRSTDGVVFVFHDDTVDRTTDGTGATEDLSWEALSALDAGHWWTRDDGATYPRRGQGLRVPSLEALLEALPEARLNLDIKSRDEGVAFQVADLLLDHGAEHRTCVGSFDAAVAAEFRSRLPDSCAYYPEDTARWQLLGDLLPVESGTSPRMHIYEIPVEAAGIRIASPGLVRRAHRRSQLVWIWTVNDLAEMDELLVMGVDGLITDEVALALEATADQN